MSHLKSQAIKTALVGNWEDAISINKSILQKDPNDIDALNRLAFAFSSFGNINEAKNIYQKVLSLDIKNPIATRNLKKLSNSKSSTSNVELKNVFIEEPGKTKIIELLNIADKKILSHLRPGEKLDLCIKRMKIFAINQNNQYVGMLPDDICKRLINFIKDGNQYDAYAKNTDSNKITIFVRELKRVNKNKNQPSFINTEKTKFSIVNNVSNSKNAPENPKNK